VSKNNQCFYKTSFYFDVDVPANRKYKELVYVAQLAPHIRKRAIPNGPSEYVSPSLLKTILPDEWEYLQKYSGKYFYNIPSARSIEIAEMKIDEVRPWPSPDRFHSYALAMVDKMLEVPLSAESMTDEETRQHLDLKKGPSIPWKWLGFKDRQSVYDSEVWLKNFENIEFLEALLAIYESCGKEELADLIDFITEKLRTFQTTSAHLLYWQIRLFGLGTENMKNFKWSKYGFNPFYGGTDKWYRELNVVDDDGNIIYKVRLNWDISGYDRKVLLHYVADRRYRLWCQANPNSPHKRIAKWVTDALKKSFLLFHNGDLVIRLRGNNSGSGMTTVNNIEAGFEIMADLLTYVYYQKHGYLPEPELVYEQLVNLFGDDNSMALKQSFDGILDVMRVKERLLGQHGLECKWLVGGVERPWADLPFLGFVFSEYKNFFIPKWNLARLIHPILYTPNRKTSGQYLQQFYSLLVMSFAHQDVFEELRLIYIKVLQHFINNGQPDVKMMLTLGVPSREYVEVFYLGLESDSKIPLKWTGDRGGPLVIDLTRMSSQYSEDYTSVCKALEQARAAGLTKAPPGTFSPDEKEYKCPFGHINAPGSSFCFSCTMNYIKHKENRNEKLENEQLVQFARRRKIEDIAPRSTECALRVQYSSNGDKTLQTPRCPSPVVNTITKKYVVTDSEPKWCEREDCPYHVYQHVVDFCEGVIKCLQCGDLRFGEIPMCNRCYQNATYYGDDMWYEDTDHTQDMIKAGSFNPYGNSQTADSKYINVFRPNYENTSDGQVLCSSTVQYDDSPPMVVAQTADDFLSAFVGWENNLINRFENWDPLFSEFIKHLQTLPKPSGPLSRYWSNSGHQLFKHMMADHFGIVQPVRTPSDRTVPDISSAQRYVQISRPTYVELTSSSFYINYIYSIDGLLPQMATSGDGSAPDQESAFIAWLSDIDTMFLAWEPVTLLHSFVKDLKKLDPPSSDHPLSFVWSSDIDHTLDMIFEGFNPYGNGQPKMNQAQYLARNKLNHDKAGLNHEARVAAYNKYLNSQPRGQKGIMTTQKIPRNNRVAPTKKEINKSINSQINLVERRKKAVKEVGNVKKMFRLSVCARIYYAALVCPFYKLDESCAPILRSLRLEMYKSENPCIPTIPNIKSRKFSAFARGDLQVSTGTFAGSAFLAFAPRRLANNASQAAYGSCPIYTSGGVWPSSAGCPYPASLETATPVDTGCAGYNLNAEFVAAQLPLVAGRGIKYRVVAAGLRVRYTGTEVNMAGTIHATIQPNHDTLAGADVSTLGQLETYFRYPVSKDWFLVYHTPVMDDDFLYYPDAVNNPGFFGTTISLQSFQHYMGFQVTDCPGGSFQWECVVHYEVVGSEVRGLTATPADVVGVSAVLNTATAPNAIDINKMSQKGMDIGKLLDQGANMVSGLMQSPITQAMFNAL